MPYKPRFCFPALFLLVVPILSNAQENFDPQLLIDLCEEILCYEAGEISVRLADGATQETSLEFPMPIALNGIVTVFQNASFFVTGNIENGRLVNIQAIEEPDELSSVLHIRLWQEDNGPATTLSITNYFDSIIEYEAYIMPADSEDLRYTSSCPVPGNGRTAYESWPEPLFQLLIMELQVTEIAGGQLACD